MRRWIIVGATAAVLGLAACSSPSQQASTATDVPPIPTVAAVPGSAAPVAPVANGGAFGPLCASLPRSDDPGSLGNMSDQPVAGAIASNPDLSTLAGLISRAGLTGTLNATQGLTVFAPTNAAFAALPAAQLSQLTSDPAKLTQLLRYHVATARLLGTDLQGRGTITPMTGGPLRIGGTVPALTVQGAAGSAAKVVCGNVATQNANVFMIDSVLLPG